MVDLWKVHSVCHGVIDWGVEGGRGWVGGVRLEAGIPVRRKTVGAGVHGRGWCGNGEKGFIGGLYRQNFFKKYFD